MELGAILFLVVGVLVLLVILAYVFGSDGSDDIYALSDYRSQISEARNEGRHRMMQASDAYLQDVQDITWR